MRLAEKICMDLQGKGIGSIVIEGLKTQASALGKPTQLIALKESPANVFYLSQVFFECEEGVGRNYFLRTEGL